jgi:hypothetical protein
VHVKGEREVRSLSLQHHHHITSSSHNTQTDQPCSRRLPLFYHLTEVSNCTAVQGRLALDDNLYPLVAISLSRAPSEIDRILTSRIEPIKRQTLRTARNFTSQLVRSRLLSSRFYLIRSLLCISPQGFAPQPPPLPANPSGVSNHHGPPTRTMAVTMGDHRFRGVLLLLCHIDFTCGRIPQPHSIECCTAPCHSDFSRPFFLV